MVSVNNPASKSVFRLVDGGEPHTLEDQLALLAAVSHDFAESLDHEKTLELAISRFLEYLEAEAGSMFLLDGDGRTLVCHKCVGPVDITGLRLDVSQGIVGKTVCNNHPAIVRDVRLNPDFSTAVDKDTGFITRSILCAPLSVRGECIGAMELINKRTEDGLFDERDLHLLTALSSAAALAIHNSRMAKSLVKQERMQRELELAREIQRDLLPKTEQEDLPVAGVNYPAWEVSGDFYDFSGCLMVGCISTWAMYPERV